jgi:hypothetical protein
MFSSLFKTCITISVGINPVRLYCVMMWKVKVPIAEEDDGAFTAFFKSARAAGVQ